MAEYADGTLSDEAAARRLVASCATCRSEYEAQKGVRETLADVPAARMTEIEKAALHRELWTELRSPVASPERGWAWRGWAAGAAAAAFVALGLLGVMSQLGGGDSAANEEATILDGESFTRDNTESGATSVPEALSPSGDEDYFYSQSSGFESVADKARRSRLDNATTDLTGTTTKEQQTCLDENDLDGFSIVEGMEEFTPLLVAIGPLSDNDTPDVVFINPESCEIVRLVD